MKTTVWIADDDPSILWVLERALETRSYQVRRFEGGEALLRAFRAVSLTEAPAAIITDIRMPGMTGLELLEAIHQHDSNLPVIVMTAYSDLESAVSSYQAGAFEYLPKPFDVDDALKLVEKALEKRSTAKGSAVPSAPTKKQDVQAGSTQFAGMIGQAPAMQEVFQAIGRLSRSHISVLIRGESGTGKELVARALHRSSPRADKTFVEINTAAIPVELLESELFGHEKGAFTGADSRRAGRFEQADGGTLFLDEIGDMPAELQTRLLRVLSESRFFRVGGRDQLSVDVRILAATNQDLDARVKDGRFRLDLFHRLNVVTIDIPPLRNRAEDIPLLTRHFLARAAKEFEIEEKTLDPEAMVLLQAYRWPGNVRELQNLCQRLSVMVPGERVTPSDLPDTFRTEAGRAEGKTQAWEQALRASLNARFLRGETAVMDSLQPRLDRLLIDSALAFTDGHKQKAARLLGWGRNTLTRKQQEIDEACGRPPKPGTDQR